MLGLLGGNSAGLAAAPALQVLTWPLLALAVLMMVRAWYLELSHGEKWSSPWGRRSGAVLTGSTTLALMLWSLRFTGPLGESPL